jgi:hypothetical protein
VGEFQLRILARESGMQQAAVNFDVSEIMLYRVFYRL